MLVSLHICDFALIDDIYLDFDAGLNVLTGETGAGKSIIIDALTLLLGGKGSAEMVKSGSRRAVIEGVLEIRADRWAEVEKAGIVRENDNQLVVSREVSSDGRSVCRVNGHLVTVATLQRLTAGLVDILGQHEYQQILKRQCQLDILDSLGGESLAQTRQKVQELYGQLRSYDREKDELKAEVLDEREIALLESEVEEIERAKLAPGEEERLEAEERMLVHAEKLKLGAEEAYERLYHGSSGPGSVYDQLSQITRQLKELEAMDPSLGSVANRVESCLYEIQEVGETLRDYRDRVDYDPSRLRAVQERLNALRSLFRKYGGSASDILEELEKKRACLASCQDYKSRLEELERNYRLVEQEYLSEARKLSELRKQAGKRLSALLTDRLRLLNMPRAQFKVKFLDTGDFSPHGLDTIEFIFSANPGQPLRPLSKVASGGEMSRFMLAVKTALMEIDPVPTLVFDEIETGISGNAAQVVAKKVSELARFRQVICVSHSPHLASLADRHFYIEKVPTERSTRVTARVLDEDGRLKEIARILSGQDSQIALEHAKELRQRALT